MREWRRDGADNDRRDDGKEGARGGCNTAAYRTTAMGGGKEGAMDGCSRLQDDGKKTANGRPRGR